MPVSTNIPETVVEVLKNTKDKRPTEAIIYGIDGRRADIRLGDSVAIVRHVEVVGDVDSVNVGDTVQIAWRHDGRPVVLLIGAEGISSSVTTTGVVPDNITIENSTVGLRVKLGGISREHLSFQINDEGGVYTDALTSAGWTVDQDTAVVSNTGIRIFPHGEISLGTGNDIIKMSSQGSPDDPSSPQDDTEYRLWVGDIYPFNAAFAVTKYGELFAREGKVGGWTLSSDELVSDAENAILHSGARPYLGFGGARQYQDDGFWVGKDTDDIYKLSIGDSTTSLQWDGTDLSLVAGETNARLEIDPLGLKFYQSTEDAADREASILWVDANNPSDAIGSVSTYFNNTSDAAYINIYAGADYNRAGYWTTSALLLSAYTTGTNPWETHLQIHAKEGETGNKAILTTSTGIPEIFNAPFYVYHDCTNLNSWITIDAAYSIGTDSTNNNLLISSDPDIDAANEGIIAIDAVSSPFSITMNPDNRNMDFLVEGVDDTVLSVDASADQLVFGGTTAVGDALLTIYRTNSPTTGTPDYPAIVLARGSASVSSRWLGIGISDNVTGNYVTSNVDYSGAWIADDVTKDASIFSLHAGSVDSISFDFRSMPSGTGASPVRIMTLYSDDTGVAVNTAISLVEHATTEVPGTPSSGWGTVYVKSDGKLYFKNDTPTEYDLTDTGSGEWTESSGFLTQTTSTDIVQVQNWMELEELGTGSVPGTGEPGTGFVALYAKTDGKVYIMDDGGTETDLTSGGTGGADILEVQVFS